MRKRAPVPRPGGGVFAESFLALEYGAYHLSMDRDALTGLLQRHPDLDGQAARDLALLLGAKLGHALEQLPSSPGLSPSDLLARVGRMRLVRQGDLWEVRNAGGDTVNLCRLLGFTP